MNNSMKFRGLGAATVAALGWACFAGGCSSSSTQTTADAGKTDSSSNQDSGKDVAPADTGTGSDTNQKDTTPPSDTSTNDSPGDVSADSPSDSGCSGTELTVINADTWCTVTVGSNAPFTGEQEVYCVPTGTAVNLSATPQGGFMLENSDNWHDQTGTENDTGGADGTASTTETPTGKTACVWVCCPGTGGSPACPTSDQCP
jgi:hypothetical protein